MKNQGKRLGKHLGKLLGKHPPKHPPAPKQNDKMPGESLNNNPKSANRAPKGAVRRRNPRARRGACYHATRPHAGADGSQSANSRGRSFPYVPEPFRHVPF